MRHIRRFAGLQRKGMALLLVMFVAFVSLALLTALFAAIAPRRTSVSQEAQANRALAVADGTIDRLLGQINNTGLTYSALPGSSTDSVESSLVSQLLVGINGGPAATASTNVRHYFYDIQTDTYYVLKNDGDPVATGTLTNLSTGVDVPGGLAGLDPTYASDNRWFQLDTNATYWYDPNKPDTWNIRTTAFNMSEPDIKRTIQAEANRGDITISPADVANGAWFAASTSTTNYFSDYSIAYHNTVNFGNLMETSGGVRSDGDVGMGGYAKGPVYASGTVRDYYPVVDHHGRFGIDRVILATAVSQHLVFNNVPQASWLTNGTTALDALKNSAASAYYVNGNATIVFSVVSGVGKVTINSGTLLDLPANGAIYVTVDATISGTVRGKVTIGANDDIYIGGNITYYTDPRIEMNAQPVDVNLQDKLGLIARSDIFIPVLTYNNNQTLTIDAAMLAVTGNFGLDTSHLSSYNSHSVNSTTHWVLTDNGSHSAFLSNSAPCMGSGSFVQGYEEQHINYDWNLTNGARPPFFPAADDSVPSHTVYSVYNNETDLLTLHALTITQLTAVPPSNQSAYSVGLRYSYILSGTTYYYGNEFNWVYAGGYAASKNSLYRVSWKEEIAQPVGGN